MSSTTVRRPNIIGGADVVGADWTPNVNPSDTSDIVGEYGHATVADASAAVDAARSALPRWASATPQERADVLDRAGNEVIARADELGDLLAREEGKTLVEARGEVVRAGQILKFHGGQALRNTGELIDSIRPGLEITVTREPLGVVGVITPWNFPIAIPAWKIAPALAYGNTVVFKPAELVPGSAWELVDILRRAGLPDGVLNLVMGRGREIGPVLTGRRAWTASRSPDRWSPARPSWRPRSLTVLACSWRWVARTRSSCSTTPTSRWLSRSRCRARSGRPVSAAPRPAD